jgi:hypothetical protein
MSEQVLLTRARGIYCEVDISPFLSSAPVNVAEVDQELSGIGFIYLGDIFCSIFSGAFLRGFVDSQAQTYAILMTQLQGGRLRLGGLDFYTKFADGSSLTTTNAPDVKDIVEGKIYRTSSRSQEIEKIYQQHQERSEALQRECGPPIVVEHSLVALAASIDEYLVRESGTIPSD